MSSTFYNGLIPLGNNITPYCYLLIAPKKVVMASFDAFPELLDQFLLELRASF